MNPSPLWVLTSPSLVCLYVAVVLAGGALMYRIHDRKQEQ